MSVWKSDEKLFIFASLISPKIILFERQYQPFDTVFHHQMKHLEVCKKFSVARRIFNSLLVVSSGDETLRLILEASNLCVAFHQSYDMNPVACESSQPPPLGTLRETSLAARSRELSGCSRRL